MTRHNLAPLAGVSMKSPQRAGKSRNSGARFWTGVSKGDEIPLALRRSLDEIAPEGSAARSR